MNIALVTSQVTYIPNNYDNLILPLLKLGSVKMLIELKNRESKLILKALGLALLGAPGVAKQLALNTLKTSSKKRKKICHQQNVEYKKIKTMNSSLALKIIKEHKIDLIINLRTRCIYKEEILKAPTFGCINVHHGLLPKYRGTMCDLYAIYEGRAAGFSVHQMEKKVDAGVIYRVQEVSSEEKDYCKYLGQTNDFEFEVLSDLIKEIEQLNKLPESVLNQVSGKAIYTKNPDKEIIKSMLAKGMKL